jgi:hypothetical protein
LLGEKILKERFENISNLGPVDVIIIIIIMTSEFRVLFPVLPGFLKISGCGTGTTQPRE